MDRTTARRIYNEFTSEVDINRPAGILRSGDVDKYLENALKPLIEEGKAFRRVSVNRRTGIRSTRYAYQGGKKIQDSIKAILAEMPAALGYDIDPDTGNVSGTNMPPPMSVTNQGKHYYTETRERILDPRTNAAIRAGAVRDGGISTFDKASGYTTTTLRAGTRGKPNNKARRMRELVKETDAKYLDGELPSSALADGPSPATTKERARAQVAQRANLKDEKRAAIEDYIKVHPDSQLAVEEALKTQKITNREEKARLLAAERTPGTPESRSRIERGLEWRSYQAAVTKNYEKTHPDDPLVKAKKARARKARNGRRAAIAKNVIGKTIMTILGVASLMVGVLAKILSSVVDVAGTLRKRQTDAARYNLPSSEMQAFTDIENSMFGLEKGTFSSVFGSIMQFSDPTMPSFSSGIERAAALLQKDVPDLLGFVTGSTHHPDQMMYELLADFINITASKRGGVLPRDTVSEAQAVNQHMVADIFGDRFAELFLRMYERLGGATIEGKSYTASQIKDSLQGTITDYPVLKTPQFTETAAEKGVKALGDLKALWESIKHGIFSHILAHMSEIAALVRNIARTVIGAYNPQWAAAENASAQANAAKDTVRLERNIAMSEGTLQPYMAKSKYTDSLTYTQEVTRILHEKDVEAITRNLGLSWEDFVSLTAEAGFALQNAQKLQEIRENSDVTMGQLQHQTAHTGGTSDAEMMNSAYESLYMALYGFRNLASADVSDMYNDRVIGPNSVLPYISPEFVVGTIQINNLMKDTLAEVSDTFKAKGYQQSQIVRGVALSDVLPKTAEIVGKYHSIEQATPELREAGITFKDIQGIIAYAEYLKPTDAPKFDPRHPIQSTRDIAAYQERNTSFDELISVLGAVGQYLGIPDRTPEGDVAAAEMVTQYQNVSAAKLNSALVQQELSDRLTDAYGFTREELLGVLKTSTGTVYTPAGSDRELRFEITVNGLPDGKPATLRGVINNEGGMSGIHTWEDGGISIRSITETHRPTPIE